MDLKNFTKYRPDKKKFSTVAKKILKGENRETETLSLAFVEESEMQKLNKQYRGKDKPTDVLSFALNEENILGEIVICPKVVERNAMEYGVSKESEMIKVFAHGVLHLLGYDHEGPEEEALKMEEKEKFYLSKI